MKGFETSSLGCCSLGSKISKKECPAMKGFETFWFLADLLLRTTGGKKECPAMKGFET